MDLAARRADLQLEGLSEVDMLLDPLDQFRRWFAEIEASGLHEPEAMVLATSSADGRPSARYVLMRGFDDRGLAFFTNYTSRKAGELRANARAAVVFPWHAVSRQVRVEGTVEATTEAESDAYFAGRPRGAQIGAWASEQSQPIADRSVLERQVAEVVAEWEGREIERPAFWGGYRLRPEVFEFWQGRTNRLHDRLQYRRANGVWVLERLSP